jgi:hypothetical protein
MADRRSLGRLVAVHPVAPAAIQRAVFIAVLSFLFFLGMMIAYYVRQDIGYFLLSTAFLIVYLAMMYAIFIQRKSTVELHEKGLRVRKSAIAFQEIESITGEGDIVLTDGQKVQLPKSVVQFDELVASIRRNSNPQ